MQYWSISNGPALAVNGHLRHHRGSAFGVPDLTNYRPNEHRDGRAGLSAYIVSRSVSKEKYTLTIRLAVATGIYVR